MTSRRFSVQNIDDDIDGCISNNLHDSRCMHFRCLLLFALIISPTALQANDLDSIPMFRLDQGERTSFQLRPETTHVAFYYSASWCPPCRKTTPALVEEYRRMLAADTMPVEIVLVCDDRTEDKMIHYIKKYEMPWPVVVWGSRATTEPFAAQGIPCLTLVNRTSGKIIAQGTGVSGEGSVETVVAEIREITGIQTETPFRTQGTLSRYGTLIAVGMTCLAILAIRKWRRSKT
jgi:thiol-disulfide isomerase/thioredoxin